MISRRRYLPALALAALLFSPLTRAAVVVNEVMANEPGSSTTLEWIELYNDSPNIALLYTYYMMVGSARISFVTDSTRLDPYEYYIVCRRLLASGSTPGFESEWGDSSGFWGDTEYEQSMQTPLDVPFSLVNSGGSIQLYNLLNQVQSEFIWTEDGRDGYSWERILPGGPEMAQSVDGQGSTPGFVNSVTPLGNDLALDDVQVRPLGGPVRLTFIVTNRGTIAAAGAGLELSQIVHGFEVPFDVLDIPDLESGVSALIINTYELDGLYVNMKAALPDDDRSRNNEKAFTATGSDYPPVILNEILANPRLGLESEWVEIKSRHYAAVDLRDWMIGDALSAYVISDSSLILNSGEYFVLVADAEKFADFYWSFAGRYAQPGVWPVLNNSGDRVRLVDPFGIQADIFEFAAAFDSNFTWSRSEQLPLDTVWGRSKEKGGTPGAENEVLLEPNAPGLSILIRPEHISPDGDGIDDEAAITVEAPKSHAYKMKIFDSQGRAVRTLVDGEALLQPVYYWDGRSDGGNRLPIGIYILYFEVAGVESIKKPIVVAR
ncbi:MAG: lamin tail domain-containing protein [candidate division Zixibacteria bacterium]|nr:lamin tail domain-containing protein [candidate division Zixibacteria bacterium]